jgi:hypothetical protein
MHVYSCTLTLHLYQVLHYNCSELFTGRADNGRYLWSRLNPNLD